MSGRILLYWETRKVAQRISLLLHVFKSGDCGSASTTPTNLVCLSRKKPDCRLVEFDFIECSAMRCLAILFSIVFPVSIRDLPMCTKCCIKKN